MSLVLCTLCMMEGLNNELQTNAGVFFCRMFLKSSYCTLLIVLQPEMEQVDKI